MSIGDIETLVDRPSNVSRDYELLFSHGARSLRSGLGAIYVKSAGNEFSEGVEDGLCHEDLGCFSSDRDPWHNLPYLVVVGAFNADGKKSSYSSAGSNLWIAAPGGEDGESEPAVLSTDQMGTDRGYCCRDGGDPLDGEAGVNPLGDYTGTANGTSGAAAIVSGAVAVLLEAAPGLTWRDIKHILAESARQIDPDIPPFVRDGRELRLPWTVNGAGYAHHNWYGFGAVDLDAALARARRYKPGSLGEFRQSGWFDAAGVSVDIPDNAATGVAQSLVVGGLPATANIEAVLLEVAIDHQLPSDLAIHLVSPHGTRSVVSQVGNRQLENPDIGVFTWRLLSNAFYGESPNGSWTVEVFDMAERDTGTLGTWSLRFYYGDL